MSERIRIHRETELRSARLEIELAGPAVADLRMTVPLRVGAIVLRSAAPEALP